MQPRLQPHAFRLRAYAATPCHVPHAPQVWEPLAAGSEALERDETQMDEIPSPVIELFELDAAEVWTSRCNHRQPGCNRRRPPCNPMSFQVELKLGDGAAEAGWTIVEAYVGARKAGNWRYVSPRGLKFKTITQVSSRYSTS